MNTAGKPDPILTPTGKAPKLAELNAADYAELFKFYYGYKPELDFSEGSQAQQDEELMDYGSTGSGREDSCD